MYWDEQAWASELVISTGSQGTGELDNESQARSAVHEAALAAEKEGLVKPAREIEAKSKKRKADSKDAVKQKKVIPSSKKTYESIHLLIEIGRACTSPILEQPPR